MYPALFLNFKKHVVLHCDSIITGSPGDTRPLIEIFNATSHRFSHTKQMPHPRVFSFMVITHKLFINRGINRFMLVD